MAMHLCLDISREGGRGMDAVLQKAMGTETHLKQSQNGRVQLGFVARVGDCRASTARIVRIGWTRGSL